MEAHRVAFEIKAEAAQPQPNVVRLKQFVLSAVAAGADALGQAAATDSLHLASQALQTF
jgi:hypothetical protein